MPPPGAGFITLTGTIPPLAISAAVIAAVSIVLLTMVVGRVKPFHCTTEVETKFVPTTVRVNAGSPAVSLLGDNDVSVGTGLSIVNFNRVRGSSTRRGVSYCHRCSAGIANICSGDYRCEGRAINKGRGACTSHSIAPWEYRRSLCHLP